MSDSDATIRMSSNRRREVGAMRLIIDPNLRETYQNATHEILSMLYRIGQSYRGLQTYIEKLPEQVRVRIIGDMTSKRLIATDDSTFLLRITKNGQEELNRYGKQDGKEGKV